MQLPKLVLKKKDQYDRSIIEISPDRLVDVPNLEFCSNPYIQSRTSGEFVGKAIYLDLNYDWVLGTDSKDVFVLVPLKK